MMAAMRCTTGIPKPLLPSAPPKGESAFLKLLQYALHLLMQAAMVATRAGAVTAAHAAAADSQLAAPDVAGQRHQRKRHGRPIGR